jgi:hypothetical protein
MIVKLFAGKDVQQEGGYHREIANRSPAAAAFRGRGRPPGAGRSFRGGSSGTWGGWRGRREIRGNEMLYFWRTRPDQSGWVAGYCSAGYDISCYHAAGPYYGALAYG